VKRRLAAYRLTPAGGGLLFILGAAVIVLAIGPRHDEGPAFIVIVLVLFAFVIGSSPMSRRSSFGESLSDRREHFHPRARDGGDAADPQEEEDAWRREREAYAERSRRDPS
jgi:hypothetical protein